MKHDRWLRIAFAVLIAFVASVLAFEGLHPSSSARALAFDVPEPHGAVTDLAGKLTPEDDAHVERRIAEYRARSGNQLGVLLIPSLDGESIEDVAYQTFNRWGVGQKGRDNGVLLVIAFREHRARIETGKGVGDRLTDLESSHILDERLAPALRRGDVRSGIDDTLSAIEAALDRPQPGAPSAPAPTPRGREAPSSSNAAVDAATLVVILLALLLPIVAFIVALARQRRRWASVPMRRRGPGGYPPVVVGGVVPAPPPPTVSVDHGGMSSFDGGTSGGGGASGDW